MIDAMKSFKLEDLVGRTISIHDFTNSQGNLTVAIDTVTGDTFVLAYTAAAQQAQEGIGD